MRGPEGDPEGAPEGGPEGGLEGGPEEGVQVLSTPDVNSVVNSLPKTINESQTIPIKSKSKLS